MNDTTLENDEKKERLAKVLARCGVASRRKAEEMILDGDICVNGVRVETVTTFVTPDDHIQVRGQDVGSEPPLKVWMYYKPVGVITTHNDPENRPTVFEDVREKGLPHVVSVGRLDFNSEGLLLLTNQGRFAHKMEKNDWKRCYRVRVYVENTLPVAQLLALKDGITLEGIHYKGVMVDIPQDTGGRNIWLDVTLQEGKNREIRKIMNHFDLQVNRLIRVSYGPFVLNDLKPGEVRVIKRPLLQEILSEITTLHEGGNRGYLSGGK